MCIPVFFAGCGVRIDLRTREGLYNDTWRIEQFKKIIVVIIIEMWTHRLTQCTTKRRLDIVFSQEILWRYIVQCGMFFAGVSDVLSWFGYIFAAICYLSTSH